jgi:hypothetical protein
LAIHVRLCAHVEDGACKRAQCDEKGPE